MSINTAHYSSASNMLDALSTTETDGPSSS